MGRDLSPRLRFDIAPNAKVCGKPELARLGQVGSKDEEWNHKLSVPFREYLSRLARMTTLRSMPAGNALPMVGDTQTFHAK